MRGPGVASNFSLPDDRAQRREENHLNQAQRQNLLAVLACFALAAIFAAVAWWACSGVLAAHESADEQLQQPARGSQRAASFALAYSAYLTILGVLAGTLSLAAVVAAAYILLAMRRIRR